MNKEEKLTNIMLQMNYLYSLITVILESCDVHEYDNQVNALYYAKEIALKLLAKLNDLDMEWPDRYYSLDIDKSVH